MRSGIPASAEASLDWCHGCASGPKRERNLPANFTPGDPVGEGLTVHRTPREPKEFIFIGPTIHGNRHYL